VGEAKLGGTSGDCLRLGWGAGVKNLNCKFIENATQIVGLLQSSYAGAWWACDDEVQTRSFAGQRRLALKIGK
jgi:hypothetical protein